ncbi:MAG: hypothetical protein CM15mP32_6260 [Flavobacteriaceae bacterium]|nr:MAG: hypothetical protein CM15mP32_6260 [Flavobacteriaceae bacterium]
MGSVEAMRQGSKDRYFQDVEDDIKNLFLKGLSEEYHTRGVVRKHSSVCWWSSFWNGV